MRKKRRKKIPYSKMPLEQLKLIEADILSKNSDLENQLHLYHEEEKRIATRKEVLQKVNDRYDEIRHRALIRKEHEYLSAGFFKKFSFDKTKLDFTEAERTEINSLFSKEKVPPVVNKYRAAYEASELLKQIQKYISQKEKKEQEETIQREKIEAKRKIDMAVIAAYKGESRILANQIKPELKKQMNIDSQCPYCGCDMGSDPHCDHIYPISKGGLSTPENMVYVCSACNLKKTDLTLTQFVKKYKFIRLEIERRLEKLEKDY